VGIQTKSHPVTDQQSPPLPIHLGIYSKDQLSLAPEERYPWEGVEGDSESEEGRGEEEGSPLTLSMYLVMW
jgi:hypothetical protein